jgi:hypothetical protein
MFKRAWKIAAAVQTTFWLLGLITLFFVIGSIYFRFETRLLPQLNFQLIQDWMANIGWQHPGVSWWFFILLFLLLLLGINTVACSIDRLRQLLTPRRRSAKLEFAVTLTPTVIHLVFIVVLCGHLLSSFTGSVEKVSCAAGQTIELSGQRFLQVRAIHHATHDHPQSLQGKLKAASADLHFHSPSFDGYFTTAILSPVFRAGYSFHLDSIDKYARTSELRLIIRRDAGIRIIIPGLLVIILLMAWYFPALRVSKNKSNSKEE